MQRSDNAEEGKAGSVGCAGRSGRMEVRTRLTDLFLTAKLTCIACNYSLYIVVRVITAGWKHAMATVIQ
ncbi:MAG: hypothetical protein ATN36_00690 [Epulopiscium sp. Nele67-Bin005]|nr:MAG: hypothetical protein ATN36_00690 [Epulopiscium sp. Nele67-Bin005]